MRVSPNDQCQSEMCIGLDILYFFIAMLVLVFLQSKVSISYALERTQLLDTHAQVYVLLCTKSLPLSPASLSLLPLPSSSLSTPYLVLQASVFSLPLPSPIHAGGQAPGLLCDSTLLPLDTHGC